MPKANRPLSRRTFLATGIAPPLAAGHVAAPGTLVEIDHRKLVSRADLVYEKPAERSEEGIPIGNGRMGTLVWTTPASLRMQINRVDVYANNSATNSFSERHGDYCGGCGFVDIDFAGFGEDVFPAAGFAQRLSLYDGLLTIEGKNVAARALASPAADVMAVSVEDRRPAPASIEVSLRMLRYAAQYFGQELEKFARDNVVAVRTRSHVAASRLIVRGERIVLTQEFREGGYCAKSAVAIGIAGREGRPRLANETELRLSAAPGPDKFTILIASAATMDPKEDVAEAALRQLESAAQKRFPALAAETARWWHDFWSRGFVQLRSADGTADFIEQNYTYFLYLMAAASRGKFPPKFNGMLWNTGGDLRTWGAQHWFANLSCYYEAVPATNRMELLEPVFDMYSGMYEACATASRQQWDSQGLYIPETVYFDGLEKLPYDIASEMRDLYLLRKPWDQRSERFRAYAETKHPHSSRWNWNEKGSWVNGRWVTAERGSGPFGNVNHIFGTTAKIAYLYWRRYEYTLDREWLRNRAYPMLKGAAEFYRNFPNVRKGPDGKHHIHQVNSNESVWGARDTDEDLSAMRGVFAALLRASEVLDVDAPLRPLWREFLDNLAPLPVSDHPDALRPADYGGPRVFVRGLKPAVRAGGFLPDANSLPMWWFDLCAVEAADREVFETARRTFDAYFRSGLNAETPVGVLSKIAIAAAALGRADAARVLIANQIRGLTRERSTAYRGGGVLANRMALREGPQALDAQRLGRAAEALHLALLQSNPPRPGDDPVLHVFPAWPREWDAQYTLAARGAFLVTSSMRQGQIEFVELLSQAGAECRLRNPWGEGPVTLHRDGKASETLRGSLLRFPTRRGERIVALPPGVDPAKLRRAG
ncbi:MAG: DUF5703 domain-containing protein [Acidobacteriota bacterium]